MSRKVPGFIVGNAGLVVWLEREIGQDLSREHPKSSSTFSAECIPTALFTSPQVSGRVDRSPPRPVTIPNNATGQHSLRHCQAMPDGRQDHPVGGGLIWLSHPLADSGPPGWVWGPAWSEDPGTPTIHPPTIDPPTIQGPPGTPWHSRPSPLQHGHPPRGPCRQHGHPPRRSHGRGRTVTHLDGHLLPAWSPT